MNDRAGFRKRTSIWLGAGGHAVSREDDMVLVSHADPGEREDLEVFIAPELFPALRRAMKAAGTPGSQEGPRLATGTCNWCHQEILLEHDYWWGPDGSESCPSPAAPDSSHEPWQGRP